MTLTKSHIANIISEETGFPITRSAEILEILLKIIKRTLESGEGVLVSGFEKLCVKEKELRKGRNPATGENLLLYLRRIVTFKCSRYLRHKINQIF
jgi:integration host factor subunit alpha